MNLGTPDKRARAFAAEVAQLRAVNLPGESGRLRELFDFLADRSAGAGAASQAEIADTVFGQTDASGDDATVRVYIHRLRKRLDDHYAAHPPA
ncbi:MAG: winged helix-turn-helix domain-containing protein, partial [Croceibacterium sp.]